MADSDGEMDDLFLTFLETEVRSKQILRAKFWLRFSLFTISTFAIFVFPNETTMCLRYAIWENSHVFSIDQ